MSSNFKEFLTEYEFQKHLTSRRLIIDLKDLHAFSPVLHGELKSKPEETVKKFEEMLNAAAADTELGSSGVVFHVGFSGPLPIVNPRDLSAVMLNRLVCCEGIITKCTLIRPKVSRSVHYCEATGDMTSRTFSDDAGPAVYPSRDDNGNPLTTEFGLCSFDYQVVTVEDMPERAPAGQLPRSAVRVVLENDLVDTCKPGDRVRVYGIYGTAKTKGGGHVMCGEFAAQIVANNVVSLADAKKGPKIVAADVQNIRKAAQEPNIFQLLAHSLASSICGHEFIKKAMLLQLLGGCEKNLDNKTHIRGDVNILMVGDPSTAKCLSPHELVLTGDGRSVYAKDVMVGDVLVGGDRSPRIVVSTTRGEDVMYRVTEIPVVDARDVRFLTTYHCNGAHLMVVKGKDDPTPFSVEMKALYDATSVGEDGEPPYLVLDKCMRGMRCTVSVFPQEMDFEGLVAGLVPENTAKHVVSRATQGLAWLLGACAAFLSVDGHAAGIDWAIRPPMDYVALDYAAVVFNLRLVKFWNMTIVRDGDGPGCRFLERVAEMMGFSRNLPVQVPGTVRSMDAVSRTSFLRGMVDTVPTVSAVKENLGYCLCIKIKGEDFTRDIMSLARSVGLLTLVVGYTMHFYGPNVHPFFTVRDSLCRRLVRPPAYRHTWAPHYYKFRIDRLSKGRYYGFMVAPLHPDISMPEYEKARAAKSDAKFKEIIRMCKDARTHDTGTFLLADCTVTHNSYSS